MRDAASDVSIGTGGADGGLPDSSTPLDSATIHSDPFRWTKSGAFSQLPSSAPEELTGGAGAATGMSADGSTIFGYYVSTTGSTSVRRWVGGAVPELLGSGKTLPMSVSADGRTAVINQQDVWRESAASLTIQDPTAFKLVPQLVSADGSTVVGYWQATAVAPLGTFIWDAVRGVRHLPCTMCTPTTVSAHGKVIGGSFYNGKTGDFVWDEKHGMRELQDLLVGSGVTLPAGATIVTLISMSHDARVFAGAVSLPSDLQAYKATLPADAFD